MLYPLKDKYYITQEFGENPAIYKRFGLQGHNGVDFRTKYKKTPKGWRYCYAVKDGRVLEINNQGNRGYGIYIRLRHEGKEQTLYGHLKKSYVKKGQQVKQGQRIGLTDNTGFSTGSHLHFGWRPDNFNYNNGYAGYEDPLPYFRSENIIRYSISQEKEDKVERIKDLAKAIIEETKDI